MYKSNYDSLLYIFLDESQINFVMMCYEFIEFEGCANYSYPFDEAILHEFEYLQQKNILQETLQSADSLAKHIIEKMKGKNSYIQVGKIYNFETDSINFYYPGLGMCDMKVWMYMDTLRFCHLETQSSQSIMSLPNVGPRKIAPKIFDFKNLKGAILYKSFDLNGNLLEQGLLQNFYKAPLLPIILKVEGMGVFYLK